MSYIRDPDPTFNSDFHTLIISLLLLPVGTVTGYLQNRVLLRTQEISVALLINPRNVGGEIRKTFVIKCAN